MKVCSKCNTEKNESEFYIDRRYGRPFSRCKVCYSKSSYGKRTPDEMDKIFTRQMRCGQAGRKIRFFERYLQALREIDYATPGYVD